MLATLEKELRGLAQKDDPFHPFEDEGGLMNAIARERDPWARLEAACAAHLTLLVGAEDVSLVGGTSLFHPARAHAHPAGGALPHRDERQQERQDVQREEHRVHGARRGAVRGGGAADEEPLDGRFNFGGGKLAALGSARIRLWPLLLKLSQLEADPAGVRRLRHHDAIAKDEAITFDAYAAAMTASLVGWLSEKGWDRSFKSSVSAMLLGSIVIYLVGVPWLANAAGMDAATALEQGMYPFVIGDTIKLFVAAGLMDRVGAEALKSEGGLGIGHLAVPRRTERPLA